jgi:hypothetical protein
MFNQNDVRNLQERQKDLQREVEQQRLARQTRTIHPAQSGATGRSPQKHLPLWMRVWMFL